MSKKQGVKGRFCAHKKAIEWREGEFLAGGSQDQKREPDDVMRRSRGCKPWPAR